jgi:carbonic anhydrase/acetyltransferase-like protein (isoleucine patch superfamily)
MVMLHGCTIGEGCLIGIKSVVMNGARIGKNCLIGAGSLVTEGKEFPDRSLILGTPAKVVRQLTDEEVQGVLRSARHYVALARRYLQALQPQQ